MPPTPGKQQMHQCSTKLQEVYKLLPHFIGNRFTGSPWNSVVWIPVHSAILCVHSEVFERMLNGGMRESFDKEVVVEQCDPTMSLQPSISSIEIHAELLVFILANHRYNWPLINLIDLIHSLSDSNRGQTTLIWASQKFTWSIRARFELLFGSGYLTLLLGGRAALKIIFQGYSKIDG